MREKTDSEQTNALLKDKMLKRLPAQDRISTPVEGLMLTRRDEISLLESCFYCFYCTGSNGFNRRTPVVW
ncbi:hypothetical protein AGMMS50256_24560 [Betaproteobacteria bacterium]|nr:hypothetical protein AGMMS50256_24560 [Betaproteobacteria bacterium]